jgi:GDSL/SGNH-like Acyl-Esterase family found in Pmr5 and Cas1p
MDTIETRAVVEGPVVNTGSTLLPPTAMMFGGGSSASSSSTSVSFLQRPLRPREVIRRGHWVHGELPAAPYHPSDDRGRVTICYGTSNISTIKPWPTYFWSIAKDSNCRLVEWNVARFCELMKGQTITVIGDSISHEFFISLVYMLGGDGATYREMLRSEHRKVSVLHEVCIDTVVAAAAAAANDTAAVAYAAAHVVKLFYHRDDSLQQLPTVLIKTQPDVIILNRGTHYVDDTTLVSAMRGTIQLLETYQQQHQQRTNGTIACRIFWRTTPPGHPQCRDHKVAVNDVEAMEALVADPQGYEWTGKPPNAPKFYWWLFKGQNALVLQEFAASNLTYDVIDGYDLMIGRPDSHLAPSDCLHSCFPGKMDVYPQLLLHYLSMEPMYNNNKTIPPISSS